MTWHLLWPWQPMQSGVASVEFIAVVDDAVVFVGCHRTRVLRRFGAVKRNAKKKKKTS